VLWDEAQDDPGLLRFLAPFGRPSLPRIEACLRESSSERAVLAESYPVFATWLATLVQREGTRPPSRLSAREVVNAGTLFGALEVDGALTLEGYDTVVVAGALSAPVIRTRGLLVVAGEVSCTCFIADGCTLIGGSLRADVISVQATRLSTAAERRTDRGAGAVAFVVAGQVRTALYDSPRLGPGGEVDAQVIIRGAGLKATGDWQARARALLVDPSAVKAQRVDFEALAARAARGEALLR
jgi:hypothetical protein